MRKVSMLVGAAIAAVPSVGFANLIVQLPGFSSASPFTAAFALSQDGNTVVGLSRYGSSGGSARPFRWSPGDAVLTNLGTLSTKTGNPPGDNSYAVGVSADGSVIVGASPVASGGGSSQSAFKYTSAGIVNLGQVATGATEVAGVSDDGSTVLAYSPAGGLFQAVIGYVRTSGSSIFRPLSGMGTASGPVPANVDVVTAESVSSDGKVIAGRFFSSANFTYQTFRWTATTGFVTIGAAYPAVGAAVPYPHGGFNRTPVSGDGNWIAGTGVNPATSAMDAFRYDVTTGTTTWLDVSDAYANANLVAMDITDDGNYIVGRGIDGFGGWIWSSGSGFETITQFLSEHDLSLPDGTGAVFGIAEAGDQLDLVGSTGFLTSYYAQVAIPEPGLAFFAPAIVVPVLLRRRRR